MQLLINVIRTKVEGAMSGKAFRTATANIENKQPDYIYHALQTDTDGSEYILSSTEQGKPLVECVKAYLAQKKKKFPSFSIVTPTQQGLILINVGQDLSPLEQNFNEPNTLFFDFIEEHGKALVIVDQCIDPRLKAQRKNITFLSADTDTLLVQSVDELAIQAQNNLNEIFQDKRLIAAAAGFGVVALAFLLSSLGEKKEEAIIQDLESTFETVQQVQVNPYDDLHTAFQRGSSKSIYIQLNDYVKRLAQFPSWSISTIKGTQENISISVKPLYGIFDYKKIIKMFGDNPRNNFIIGDNEITINAQLFPTPALAEPVLANQNKLQNYIDASLSDWISSMKIAFSENEQKNGYEITPFTVGLNKAFIDDLDVLTTILNGFPVIYESFELTANSTDQLNGKINFSLYSCGKSC